MVKSKNSQYKVTVPYSAHVLKGSLKLEDKCTHFFLPDADRNGKKEGTIDVDEDVLLSRRSAADGNVAKQVERNVTVTNEFSVPVVVHRVSMGSEEKPKKQQKGLRKEERYFVLQQAGPVLIKPGEKMVVAKLTLKHGAWKERLLDSTLTLHTNVTKMVVPLVVYHGKMDTVMKKSL